MNLFLALHIQPDEQLKKIYFNVKRLLRNQRAKLYPLDQMFLILRYLPDTEPEFISDVNRIIGNITAKTQTITVNIQGVDIYPYKVMPRILWFRVEPLLRLMHLAEQLNQELTQFGYAPEDFTFYPHITFARLRKIDNPKVIDAVEQKFQTFPTISYNIDQLLLIQSISTKGPNEYKVRNRFKFNPTE